MKSSYVKTSVKDISNIFQNKKTGKESVLKHKKSGQANIKHKTPVIACVRLNRKTK